MRTLHDCSNRHGELSAASSAKINSTANATRPCALGLQFGNALVAGVFAVRTHRTVWPAQGFQKLAGLGFLTIRPCKTPQDRLLRFRFGCIHADDPTRQGWTSAVHAFAK